MKKLEFAIVLGIGHQVPPEDLETVAEHLKRQGFRIRRKTTLGHYAVDIAREHHRAWMDGVNTIVTIGGFDAGYPQLLSGIGLAWDRLVADPKAKRPILVDMQTLDGALVMTEPPRVGVYLETTDARSILETSVSGGSLSS